MKIVEAKQDESRKIVEVTLEGELSGQTINVDEESMTVGMLEDLETGTVRAVVTALCSCIVPGGTIGDDVRASIRALKPRQFKSVLDGALSLFRA